MQCELLNTRIYIWMKLTYRNPNFRFFSASTLVQVHKATMQLSYSNLGRKQFLWSTFLSCSRYSHSSCCVASFLPCGFENDASRLRSDSLSLGLWSHFHLQFMSLQFLKLFVFLDVMLLFGLGTGIVLNIIVALLPFNMEVSSILGFQNKNLTCLFCTCNGFLVHNIFLDHMEFCERWNVHSLQVCSLFSTFHLSWKLLSPWKF